MSLETPAGILRFRVEILSRSGETLNARITYGGLGGKGLNQAIAAARAKMDVRVIAAVGNDSAACLIRTRRREHDHHQRFPGGERDRKGCRQASFNFQRRRPAPPGKPFVGSDPSCCEARETKLAQKSSSMRPPDWDWCKTMIHDVDVLILNSVEAARWRGTEDLEHAIRELAGPLVVVTPGPTAARCGPEATRCSSFPHPPRPRKTPAVRETYSPACLRQSGVKREMPHEPSRARAFGGERLGSPTGRPGIDPQPREDQAVADRPLVTAGSLLSAARLA
jgi:hypothetical protein